MNFYIIGSSCFILSGSLGVSFNEAVFVVVVFYTFYILIFALFWLLLLFVVVCFVILGSP